MDQWQAEQRRYAREEARTPRRRRQAVARYLAGADLSDAPHGDVLLHPTEVASWVQAAGHRLRDEDVRFQPTAAQWDGIRATEQRQLPRRQHGRNLAIIAAGAVLFDLASRVL